MTSPPLPRPLAPLWARVVLGAAVGVAVVSAALPAPVLCALGLVAIAVIVELARPSLSPGRAAALATLPALAVIGTGAEGLVILGVPLAGGVAVLLDMPVRELAGGRRWMVAILALVALLGGAGVSAIVLGVATGVFEALAAALDPVQIPIEAGGAWFGAASAIAVDAHAIFGRLSYPRYASRGAE